MASVQEENLLTRVQLLSFLDKMSTAFEQADVKQRLADAVRAGGDAAAVSTEIQAKLLVQMGVDSKVGLDSLANVKGVYQDRECILKYLKFVEREELAREEAELGQQAFQQKRQQTKEVEEQQLKLLHQLRSLPADVQEGFLHGLSSKVQGISASTFFNSVPTE